MQVVLPRSLLLSVIEMDRNQNLGSGSSSGKEDQVIGWP
jgi:hypothetical protein